MVDSAGTEKTIQLKQVDKVCELSQESGKYQLIFDKTGNCEVFFRYKAHLIEVHKLSIGITMGKISRDEAIETLRKGLVYCMRSGDRLVLHVGSLSPDFKTVFTDAANFPTDLIFNYAEWRKEENYKKVVREDEDHDLMGNKRCYFMKDTFDIILLQDNEGDAEEKAEFKSKIPHLSECFDIINVE